MTAVRLCNAVNRPCAISIVTGEIIISSRIVGKRSVSATNVIKSGFLEIPRIDTRRVEKCIEVA